MKIKYIIMSVLSSLFLIWPITYGIDYDINKVRETWLWWNNDLRSSLKLDKYTIDNKLNETATTWSNHMVNLWYWTHKRSSKDGYYNYNSVKNWFERQWITFWSKWTQLVENIWYGYVKCTDWECTDEMIKAIKTTRDFFMSERYKSYRPHYNSLINKYYDYIGVGISMDGNKYYLTIHYTTDDISYDKKNEDNQTTTVAKTVTTALNTPKIIRKKSNTSSIITNTSNTTPKIIRRKKQ